MHDSNLNTDYGWDSSCEHGLDAVNSADANHDDAFMSALSLMDDGNNGNELFHHAANNNSFRRSGDEVVENYGMGESGHGDAAVGGTNSNTNNVNNGDSNGSQKSKRKKKLPSIGRPSLGVKKPSCGGGGCGGDRFACMKNMKKRRKIAILAGVLFAIVSVATGVTLYLVLGRGGGEKDADDDSGSAGAIAAPSPNSSPTRPSTPNQPLVPTVGGGDGVNATGMSSNLTAIVGMNGTNSTGNFTLDEELPFALPSSAPSAPDNGRTKLRNSIHFKYLNQCAMGGMDYGSCIVSRAFDAVLKMDHSPAPPTENATVGMIDASPSMQIERQRLRAHKHLSTSLQGRFLLLDDCSDPTPTNLLSEQDLRGVINSAHQRCIESGVFVSEHEVEGAVKGFHILLSATGCSLSWCDEDPMNPSGVLFAIMFNEAANCAQVQVLDGIDPDFIHEAMVMMMAEMGITDDETQQQVSMSCKHHRMSHEEWVSVFMPIVLEVGANRSSLGSSLPPGQLEDLANSLATVFSSRHCWPEDEEACEDHDGNASNITASLEIVPIDPFPSVNSSSSSDGMGNNLTLILAEQENNATNVTTVGKETALAHNAIWLSTSSPANATYLSMAPSSSSIPTSSVIPSSSPSSSSIPTPTLANNLSSSFESSLGNLTLDVALDRENNGPNVTVATNGTASTSNVTWPSTSPVHLTSSSVSSSGAISSSPPSLSSIQTPTVVVRNESDYNMPSIDNSSNATTSSGFVG
eukprot:CAMPEP_0183704966 /NCGR_PEP_ID=MMETSP0737-20130205/2172_1 /TAXON_ID=385413 /ORGANISM="Thalassiosira miniscula, Strain CCMP1093" /LENGTH=746 /DNA_ID=CAMNT_0025932005 /DNA_START=190 /DNA_END=2430 /DNA_ORIENTATION=-